MRLRLTLATIGAVIALSLAPGGASAAPKGSSCFGQFVASVAHQGAVGTIASGTAHIAPGAVANLVAGIKDACSGSS